MKYATCIIIALIAATTAMMRWWGWREFFSIIGPALTMWLIVAAIAAVLTGFSWDQIKWRWAKRRVKK